jgi:prephenate dehydrogenase
LVGYSSWRAGVTQQILVEANHVAHEVERPFPDIVRSHARYRKHECCRVTDRVMRSLPIVQPGPGVAVPVFERIGIVGLGLIGGSLALAIKQRWPAAFVIAVDRNDVLERAMVAHAIDVGAEDLGMISGAELIVLAAPVDEIVRLLGRLADLIPGEALITDVGSTKRSIVDAARSLPARLTFIGGHPIAGAAGGGFEHARADLFGGRPWILTPAASADSLRLVRFLNGLGATCAAMSADEHDRLVAFLSDLPQLTASALMQVVGEAIGGEGLAYAGRGLQDTTRLASSPTGIWKAVVASNVDQIGPALDRLISLLQQLRADLAEGEVLERVFDSARRWKETLNSRR